MSDIVKFSKEWTDKEKLRLVIIVTDIIRDDIMAGVYGWEGSPNIQTVHELIVASPVELEAIRSRIEDMITKYVEKRGPCHLARP